MREIKFRAWHKRECRWYEPTHIGVNGYRAVMSIYTGSTWLTEGHYPDDFELMQFTGLTDEHGKDIFEGDIVTYQLYEPGKTYTGAVIYRNAQFMLDDAVNLSTGMYKRVIGNIYEQPELLQKAGEA